MRRGNLSKRIIQDKNALGLFAYDSGYIGRNDDSIAFVDGGCRAANARDPFV